MLSDRALGRWLPALNVALWGDVVRAVLWAVVVLTWCVFGQIYIRLWRLTLADPGHSDFTIFYYTARLVADGLPMYGASPARYGVTWAAGHLGNLNPPHVQLLFQPLAALSYGAAFVGWTAANLLALAVSFVVIVRTLRLRVTPTGVLASGAVLMAAAPFTVVAVTAELTFLLLLPATLAWSSAREGRWALAGAWLGLCVAWKLFFLLFVPWLVFRRRHDAVAAAATVAACTVVWGVWVAGLESYRLWGDSLGAVGWWSLVMNASWQGLVSRALQGSTAIAPTLVAPWLVKPLGAAGAVVIGAVSLWSAWRLDRTGRRDPAWLTLTLGAVLASPLGWVYYLPLALGPLWATVRAVRSTELSLTWRTAALLGLAALYMPLERASAWQPSALASITLASTYFWGTLAVWLTAVVQARVSGTSASPQLATERA